MNELVFLKNNQALTTSLKVAETFGKRHTHVLDKIRTLSAEILADVPIEGFNPKFIAQTIIKGLLAGGADYHQPYQNCKLAFESYARLSFINQRLLPN